MSNPCHEVFSIQSRSRFSRRLSGIVAVFGLLALLAAAMLLPGCVQDDKSFMIVAVVYPEAPPDCTGVPDNAFESSGLLDLKFYSNIGHSEINPSFWGYLQLNNYYINTSDKDSGRLDSNKVFLERFELSYTWEVGAELMQQPGNATLAYLEESEPVVVPVGTFVESANKSDSPGQAAVAVALIPPDQGGVLLDIQAGDEQSLVLGVHVKAFGHTVGGKSVESNEFVFPIYFCRDCVGCPEGWTYKTCFAGQGEFTCEEQQSN